jgi:hypothetical protein
MAPKKRSDDLTQAVKLLRLLSETKRAAVVSLIRALAEDEDADLYADRAAVADDLAEFERFHAGERTELASSEDVLAKVRARRRGTTASVPSLI